MKKNKYYFKQHDNTGRTIELCCIEATDYADAKIKAYKRAEEICSYGVTYCDGKGKALPVPDSEFTPNSFIKYDIDKKE